MKLLGFHQVPKEIFGFGKMDILGKSGSQLTPNQFPCKSPQQRSRLASPAPNPTHTPLLEVGSISQAGTSASRLRVGSMSVT